jgi:hypothetical protein
MDAGEGGGDVNFLRDGDVTGGGKSAGCGAEFEVDDAVEVE